jgi:hypothetical protein
MNSHMNKRNNIYLRAIIALFCIFSLGSCSEQIDTKLESTYVRLVVEGSITTDTTAHKVKLSTSGDAVNKEHGHPISNALVTISDGTTVLILHENISMPGTYETDSTVYGVPGKTYTLNISNVDVNGDGTMENYTASSFLPKENPIDSIKVMYNHENKDRKEWQVFLYSLEIGGGRNFYLTKAYKNDTLVTDSISEYYNINDNTGFEGKYYGFPAYTLAYDKVDERLRKGDVVTLELDGITEEYEKFIYGFILEYYPKIPIFSGPSANVPTNIVPKDKAVGFFTAYSAVRRSVVYNGE